MEERYDAVKITSDRVIDIFKKKFDKKLLYSIEQISTDDIEPTSLYVQNERLRYAHLTAKSLIKHGFKLYEPHIKYNGKSYRIVPPPIIEERGKKLVLCDGTHRIITAKEMKMKEVIVLVVRNTYLPSTVFTADNVLFEGLPSESVCWMSHTDYVKTLPKGFTTIAHTAKCPCAAMCDESRKLYGVQFHPEVTHTVYGKQMLHNFIFAVCGCKADWKMENFVEASVEKYKKSLAGKKVLLALSGGVDSSVAAVLLHKAIGNNLTCVFVDHGLLRKDEGDFVENTFGKQFGINLIRVNAEDRFLDKLKGVTEPEQKRKIIGEEFIRVFEDVAKKLGKMDVLVQGTIYPDVPR